MKLHTDNFFNIPTRLITILSLTLALIFSGCSDDDDDSNTGNSIVTIASGTSDLSSLVAALTKFPDLVDALNTPGTYTVFAPSNAAFSALLEATGQSSLDDLPESVLRRVLEYHVVSSTVALSTDLSDGQTIATALTDNEVTVGVSGSGVTINTANVTTADVAATNGVVHIVDAVLVPALELSILNTVVEPAYFNSNFTVLTEAVVTAGLLATLIDGSADYTLFAPTNDAFAAAGINSLDGLTADDLSPILLYHVLSTEVKAADLPATGSAITSLGGTLYLSINSDGVFLNGNTEVVSTDLDYDNGVVHVINRTLTPTSQNVVEVAVAASQATEAEFGQLVAALTAIENDASTPALITALSNADGSFTIFAPTDAAFNALYSLAGVQDLDGLAAAIGLSTVATVLQYHVLGSRVFSADIPNALDGNASVTLTPLAGGTFTLNSSLTITDTDGALSLGTADASITGTDILGTNGVIHVIDQVITP